ncbi:MAG: F0F1 ATP synthase subunit epsilon [Armatimonadia bacterium]|nr:F0F1 ATP synthase subunit epsilon [Armatimonadia bacterium]
MATGFDFEILTRERSVLSIQAEEIIAPGVDGYLGVLAGHAPLVTALDVGVLTLRSVDGDEELLAISGGFMEVRPEKTVILAETAERAEEIDRARVERALRRAEERLSAEDYSEIDSERARRALARAFNRLKTLGS